MSDEEQEAKQPEVKWEKREFALNQRIKEVCRLSVKATELEIATLRRKLQKLQYGGR